MKLPVLAILVPTLAVAATAGAQGRVDPANRFASMDTNKDGRVSRAEWNGSDRSFEVHDWNRDGILSGDELRRDRRAPAQPRKDQPFESPDGDYTFTNWTDEGFRELDHNRDGKVTRDEWHFDLDGFRSADHNRDNVISRAEFLGETPGDDDRTDRFAWLDANHDSRVSRAEWHGTAERFDALDDNRDGMLTRAEMRGSNEPPPDLFTSVDVNRDGSVSSDEWHWSRASFNARDANRDGRLSRAEFAAQESSRSSAYKAGQDRGLIEGRAAGREDRERNQGWDLEGQRELESADSGYEARFGAKPDYQGGYREGFRRGYREGWNQR